MSDNGDGKKCGNCAFWGRAGVGRGAVQLGNSPGECRRLPLAVAFFPAQDPATGQVVFQKVSGYPPANALCDGCGEFRERIDPEVWDRDD